MSPKFLADLKRKLSHDRAVTSGSTPQDRQTVPTPAAAPAQFEATIGAVINGRYRLDGEIGRGGMAIVYAAHDLVNDRDVALKLLDTRENNAAAREQFLREAAITARLKHPHIIPVYETGEVESGGGLLFPFIVMEWVRGKSLDQLRGLSYVRVVDIGRQICSALDYAHSQGLVHRDIKPENVLVEQHGRRHYTAKLADFGLARLHSRGGWNEGETRGIAGSVYYLAPEVIAGQPAEVAADLYSLGALLYQMVTGRVPFSDMNEQAILDQHLKETVAPPGQSRADVPPGLQALILQLLEKDPQKRPGSAHEVCGTLAEIATARARSAHRNPLPHVTPPLTGREADVAAIVEMLNASAVVTLAGENIADRTRLALTVAERVDAQFLDGTRVVALEKCAEPARVPQAVAASLGVQAQANRALVVSLGEYLREKDLLLVLDGCDRVGGACAQFAVMVQRVCPDVVILATSGQPLNVAGERVYRLE